MKILGKDLLVQALTYAGYRSLITGLLTEGKTTGHHQSPGLLAYSQLNEQRMNRLDKTFQLDAVAAGLLPQLTQRQCWLVLAEGWCGDAAQVVPVLHQLSLLNPNIQLGFLLRDEHPDLMDAFLTNGSRSIPIVIFADPETGDVGGSWGPRPVAAQALMGDRILQMKAATDGAIRQKIYEEVKTMVHTWYAHDRTASTQREVVQAALAAQ